MYLAENPDSDLKLVLTGAPGARKEYLEQAAHRMGLSEAVVFPGYLPEDALSALLHRCMALIFPSLFEGFGMPLLEGMAAGRPLLSSNATSLPEVAGAAALYFDPRIPGEIANAIARVERSLELRLELATKSAKRLAAFGGPEEMARKYLAVFKQAVQHPAESFGVFGAFDDGWLGESFRIAYGSGKGPRTIRLELAMPQWVRTPSVSIRVEDAGASKPYTLQPGGIALIENRIGPGNGSIEVFCSPSFQPSRCGLGEDTRTLTCQLKLAEIVGEDGVPGALTSLGYGA
jgi:hypothetical protein